MKIDELILEVTRKCNMVCKHCMRGANENINADESWFPNIFHSIEQIEELTFTGGEPSLNIPYILSTLEYCKKHHIIVKSIYIVTNGLVNQPQLIDAMEKWLIYCMEVTGYTNREEYLKDNFFRIACSLDEFHASINSEKYDYIHSCGYYDDSKECSYKEYQYLIEAGNVISNKLDEDDRYVTCLSGENLNKFVFKNDTVSLVCVSCNGHVYSGCNFSYADFDESASSLNDVKIYTTREICERLK